MKNIVNLVLLLVTASPSLAFCAIPIYEIAETHATFIQVPLHHEVFQYVKSSSLNDLIVLDANGKPLPYRTVVVAPSESEVAANVVTEPLVFFPVAPDATPDTLRKLHTTQIKIDVDKTQVLTSEKRLSNTTPDFYLIDVIKIDHDLTGVRVDWINRINNQYLEVELEATRDLKNWFPIANTTLIKISQEGESLTRNLISTRIQKKDFEFLRIKILRGAENLVITNVSGEQRTEQALENPVRETWSLDGEHAKSQSTVYLPSSHSKAVPVAAWEFFRNESTPVDSLAIDLGETNYAGSVKIFSRNSEDKNWSLRHQGVWFNAQVGNNWEKSAPVSIHSIREKFWRIELNASVRDIPSPRFILGWQPYQLQIITNNQPPYRLAIEIGKGEVDNRDEVFSQLLSSTNPQWIQASLKSLNISPDTLTEPKKLVDWKQWLFWVALILAVGVLLSFSLKLLKQLNNTKSI